MARNLNEIQASILLKKTQTESLDALEVLTTSEQNTLANLNSTSKVAIWRLWVFIVAFAVFLHEQIFDEHKKEIEALLAAQKIHNALWYKGKALAFQFGFNLGESDVYDNKGVDTQFVLNSLIVKQASVEEVAGRLKIKVAKTVQNALAPLTASELFAFGQYMEKVKDAGTRLDITSRDPDTLKLEIDLYFDPLVLDTLGQRLDGSSNEPVQDAIREFLYKLEFNGELILTKLTDYLQEVEGVEMPVIKEAFTKYANFGYVEIDETYIAVSGYMILDAENSIINFIPREL